MILLVGQAPAASAPDSVLPADRGNHLAGARFVKFSGIDLQTYSRRFRRMNVLTEFPGRGGGKGDLFPRDRAARAIPIFEEFLASRPRDPVIFLGRATASLFHADAKTAKPFSRVGPLEFQRHWIPHTSGIVRFWNNTSNRDRLRTLVQGLLTSTEVVDSTPIEEIEHDEQDVHIQE